MTLYKDFVKQSSADNRKSLGIAVSSSNDASGNKSVVFDPEDHYYDSNEYYTLIKSDKENALKARSGENGGKKASKSGGHSKSGGGRNNGQGKWKSKIVIIEKKIINQKRKLLVFNTAAKPGSDNEESDELDKYDGNMKHYDLTCQGKSKHSKKT